MNNPTIDNSLTLDSVQQRFEAWRASRTKRGPIPEPSWEAAVRLCRRYPITHVCLHLRLSFADLKKRLSTANQTQVQFMEFDLSAHACAYPHANRCNAHAGLGCFIGPWHMECERPDGARLRVSVNGQPPEVKHLLEQFLS